MTVRSSLTVEEIMSLIPHRYPMLLIDRMENIVEAESATGVKNVTFNEWFFQGHFPGKPVMPGVLIIEAMAQTAAALVMETLGNSAQGSLVYFMSIDETRFRKPVLPGHVLKLHVEKHQQRGPVWKFKGKATVDDVLMAEATFAAMIADKPQ